MEDRDLIHEEISERNRKNIDWNTENESQQRYYESIKGDHPTRTRTGKRWLNLDC